MNKRILLDLLAEDAGKNAERYYRHLQRDDDPLEMLVGRRDLPVMYDAPRDPAKTLDDLRIRFKGYVDVASFLLNKHFPEQYFYFRPSKLNPEIFSGLDYLWEIFEPWMPDLDFPWPRVTQQGLDAYLKLNQAMFCLAHQLWPSVRRPQTHIAYFLYEGLGRLFLEKNDYNRYWIMATSEDYFSELDRGSTTWSGRKEMQPGDLVFFYRMSPRKAITEIFKVVGEPRFSPYWNWEFEVDIERVCQIPDISFSTLKNDPPLSEAPFVKVQFQGVSTEPLPHRYYNRLLDFIPDHIKSKFQLKPEPVATVSQSGQFAYEADFEEAVIEPLLKRWGFKYTRQHPCRFQVGSGVHNTRVDYYVRDEKGPLTLFEDKLKILDETRDLRPARDQGKSYALMLGLPSFAVASPEGLWVYSLKKNVEHLERHIVWNEIREQDDQVRALLLKLRS